MGVVGNKGLFLSRVNCEESAFFVWIFMICLILFGYLLTAPPVRRTESAFENNLCLCSPGYGTLPPTTQTGRLLCVFYALFGIPVCLLLLKSIGQVLNKCLNKLVLFIEKKCLLRENPENIARKVIIISCLCMVLYIVFFAIIGSFLYNNGTFTDHVYALFITFSTVGFGDIVLIKSEQFDISTNITIIGLVLVSTNVEAILVYLEKREEIRMRHTRGFCCSHNRQLNPSCDAEVENRDGSYFNKGAWTTEMNGGNNIEIDHSTDGMRADGGNGTYRNGHADDM